MATTEPSATTSAPTPPDKLQQEGIVPQLLRGIWRKMNVKNEHFIMVVLGREGSGKSHTALKIADAVDPSFNPDRALFSPEPLLERLRDDDHETGQVYVADEAGVQLGNRTWQEKSQVMVNQALQLIRNENLGLILTLPRLSELDSQTQGRLHSYLEITKKVDGEYVRGRWRTLSPDRVDITGDVFQKKPTVRVNGASAEVDTVAFSPPRDSLVEPYEERKREFQREFYEETLEELSDEESEEEQRAVSSIADEIVHEEKLPSLLSWHGAHKKWYIKKDKLRDEFDLTHSEAKLLKDRLRERAEVDIQTAGEKRGGKEKSGNGGT